MVPAAVLEKDADEIDDAAGGAEGDEGDANAIAGLKARRVLFKKGVGRDDTVFPAKLDGGKKITMIR